MKRVLASALGALLSYGCLAGSIDPVVPCRTSSDCVAGQTCISGSCVADPPGEPDAGAYPADAALPGDRDAGPRGDAGEPAGNDAGIDAGSRPDAATPGRDAGGAPDSGPACPPGGTPPAPCEGVTCSWHGACEAPGGTPACRCDPGYAPGAYRCDPILPFCLPPAAPPSGYPVVLASADPGAGLAPLSVVFDASSSWDPDGVVGSFAWEFGDSGTAATARATHVYNVPGRYCASAWVTDNAGNRSEGRVLATVDRPRPKLAVGMARTAVAVDSVFAEYDCAPGFWIRTEAGFAYAHVRLLWDATALYAAFEVTDATPLALVPLGGSGNIWRDDAIELFIDAPPFGGDQLAAEDRQVIVNMNGAYYLDGYASHQSAGVRTATGYRIELGLPWSEIGVVPSTGLILGANFALDDRTDPTAGAEPGYRTGDWSGSTGYLHPASWGSIELGP